MEELREAAIAYYNNCSSELQTVAWNFFRSMDVNGDGSVSLNEFVEFDRQCGYHWISPNLFAALDRNDDGRLDFWEVLSMYYMVKTKTVFCRECRTILIGLYFTCVECFDRGGDSYDICLMCYHNPRQRFSHPRNFFLDSNALLLSRRGTPNGATNLNLTRTVCCRECHTILTGLYFTCMECFDCGGDAYDICSMCYQRRTFSHPHNFFLDSNVLLRSRRGTPNGATNLNLTRTVCCRECHTILIGLYFTCVECFDCGGDAYDICSMCYQQRTFSHPHNFFLDSYVLLRSRRGTPNGATNLNLAQPSNPQPLVVARVGQPARRRWLEAFQALEMAFAIGSLASAGCTIM